MKSVQLRRLAVGLKRTDAYSVNMWLFDYQVDSEQRPHKVSFYVDKGAAEEVIKTLAERLKEREVRFPSSTYCTSCSARLQTGP